MLNVNVEKIGDVAVVHCEGRVVRSDAVFRLRDAVTQQRGARIVLLDLSEVESLEGGGLGMLVFLQRWSQDHGIQFKLFDPPDCVRQNLEHTRSAAGLEIAAMDEVLSMLGWDGTNWGNYQELGNESSQDLRLGRCSAAGSDVLGQFPDHVSRESGDDRARHRHHQ